MSKKPFNLLIFIGRFQPLHIGHERVIRQALENADQVLILIGSANRSRTIKNPWTFNERNDMLNDVFKSEIAQKFSMHILPLNDYMYNDPAWLANVQSVVSDYLHDHCSYFHDKPRIGVMDFAPDHVSYDNGMFKPLGWEVFPVEQTSTFHSTAIRHDYFRKSPIIPTAVCSEKVQKYLSSYMYTKQFTNMVKEFEFHEQYWKQWGKGPFITTDAVVTQSGHILLINRGEHPGKNQLALPGGFLNQGETLEQGVIRELLEETRIDDGKSKKAKAMPAGILKNYIKTMQMFDDPDRSTRAHIVTAAFHFELPDADKLWSVEGADDAAHAAWYPIGTIPPEDFFEDHYFIMSKMLGLTM